MYRYIFCLRIVFFYVFVFCPGVYVLHNDAIWEQLSLAELISMSLAMSPYLYRVIVHIDCSLHPGYYFMRQPAAEGSP